ncbi:DNA-binding transcriptional regulator, AcrR family [Thermomonospora echinospora]|uniref:DNA-binding transcriptional regulator, AcrR family n=1 Tax=Thermomonospora echinospora TaxID=1992 RepID=A0A1H6DKD2_9ACTN|nr:TetR/AcrR family transcriptional regulator [Thermomonospora echinospora]SEG85136.1 DNA-binding transcriptional regulator, AcrR family [Thermomonospora echinospora]
MGNTRREEILEAAMDLFAEHGYRGASLDQIAERVGLTRQGLLHYFPSKKKLLIALLGRREELNREHLVADHLAEKDWPTQVAEAVAFDREHPALARIHTILMAESLTEGHPAREYFRDHQRTVREHITRRLSERYGDRLPSGLSTQAAAAALLALIEGLQQQWLLDLDQTDHPEVMRSVWSVLLGPTTP